jgi:hypothetical protein
LDDAGNDIRLQPLARYVGMKIADASQHAAVLQHDLIRSGPSVLQLAGLAASMRSVTACARPSLRTTSANVCTRHARASESVTSVVPVFTGIDLESLAEH